LSRNSQSLVSALHRAAREAGIPASIIELAKDLGQARVDGQGPLGEPAWRWPRR
jgi:hypothetical protein